MKVLNILFVVMFVFFAALQYNDPDPYLWMPIYLYAAYLCYQASRRIVRPKLYAIGIIFYLVYAAYLFFDRNGVWSWVKDHNEESIVQTMKATKPWIEETREFLGLGIVIGTLVLNWLVWRRRNRKVALHVYPKKTSTGVPVS